MMAREVAIKYRGHVIMVKPPKDSYVVTARIYRMAGMLQLEPAFGASISQTVEKAQERIDKSLDSPTPTDPPPDTVRQENDDNDGG